MSVPVIHIGFPKTASTWLQKRLLPLYGDIALLRRSSPGAEWIEALATASARPGGEFGRAGLRAEFEACARAAGGRTPLVSYEAFVGDPFCGPLPIGGSLVGTEELARRVRAVIPEARIAMVVREPVALLESLYRQYVQIGGLEKPGAALRVGAESEGAPVLDRAFAHFDHVHAIWSKAFGAEQVNVFVYEELLENPRAFVDRFVGLAGAGPHAGELPAAGANRGTSGAALSALRIANRLAQSRFNPRPWLPAGWVQQKWLRRAMQRGVSPLLRGGAAAAPVFEAAVRAELREHFCPHNAALEAVTGLDLGRYGYSR